jgi:hypothetical protein
MSKVENEKSTKRNKEGCLHTKIQIKTSTNYKLSEPKHIYGFNYVIVNKGNNKITELRTILQRESQKHEAK